MSIVNWAMRAPYDGPDAEFVALVNESFVRTQLGGADPIDVIVRQSRVVNRSGDTREIQTRIVGVVEDVVQTRAEEGPRAAFYVPITQYGAGLNLVVRIALPADLIVPELRGAAGRLLLTPPDNLGAMRDGMSETRTNPRFQTMLIGAFALVALLLAAAGLYGALAHSVGRRQRELGVRMALGAGRAGVLRMVLGQGVRLSMTGLAVGLLASLFFTRVLSGFLYDVEPNDPVVRCVSTTPRSTSSQRE